MAEHEDRPWDVGAFFIYIYMINPLLLLSYNCYSYISTFFLNSFFCLCSPRTSFCEAGAMTEACTQAG